MCADGANWTQGDYETDLAEWKRLHVGTDVPRHIHDAECKRVWDEYPKVMAALRAANEARAEAWDEGWFAAASFSRPTRTPVVNPYRPLPTGGDHA